MPISDETIEEVRQLGKYDRLLREEENNLRIKANLKSLMYGLLKEARRVNFIEFLEFHGLTEDDFWEIKSAYPEFF